MDEMGLLKKMHLRFENKRSQFEASARKYNTLNMSMAMTMILFQIILIAINQFTESQIPSAVVRTICVILASVTGALIGLQLKLRWGEKCDQMRRGAEAYTQLLRSSTYKLQILECGGKLGKDGVHQFWQEAIQVEDNDVPGYIDRI